MNYVHTLLFLATICSISLCSGCRSQSYSGKLALVGGLAGTGAGAAIGERNGNPIAGAVIGGTIGTLAGNAIGQSVDADIARNNAIIEQQLGWRLAGAVTNSDVVSMSQAGLGDDVITTHIRANGVAHPPTVNDMIALKQQGVSDRVINEMQKPPLFPIPPPRTGPVVVEEYHYLDRPHHYYPRRSYHHHHGRSHTRNHWGVSFGGGH